MLLSASQITEATVRIFRNNVGTAYAGKPVRVTLANYKAVTLSPGDVVVRQARPLHAGLMKGSGDGIGWSTVTITPEMVDRQVAVFTSAEAKASSGGRVSKDQQTWHENVLSAGGISVIVREPDDLRYAVMEFIGKG